jgi:dTDP-4-amino-4,6-dideoxygalactose transaminase
MGVSQLMKLKEFLKRRREIARKYNDAIRITSHKSYIHIMKALHTILFGHI